MAEENKPERKGTIVYPEVKEEDAVLYSNAILVNHTPWDFALHFSQIIAPTQPKADFQIKGKPVAVINIPVTLVRGLIEALETNITHYEQTYGKVQIPKKRKEHNGNGSDQ